MPNTNSITLDEAVAPVNPAPASSMTLEEAVGGPSHLEVAPSTGQDPDTAGWDTHWYSPITTLPGRIWSAIENRQQQDNSGLIAPPEPMTQQDVSAYKDLFGEDGRQLSGGGQARMENWGFTPQQVAPHWGARFTGTQQQLAQWQKQNAPQNYKSIQNPLKLWVNNSLPANMIHYAFNAPYYEAMKYNAVKTYERANHIVMNAAEYAPQQVKLANVVIKELKNTGPGFLANFKNLYHQIVSHPEQFGVGLVNGITADPELLLSGKIFGGIADAGLAKLGLGAAEGAAINAGISAGQQLRDTGQVHFGPTAAAGVQGLGIGALTSSFHVKGAEAKPSIKDMPDHTGGQGTPPPATPPPSTPPAGETTPTPESMTLDEAIRGISEGKTPATEGTTAKDAKKAASRSRAKAPASTDRVAQTDSGQPLHPYTPVDTTKNVDLAGGVAKNGRVVISKEIPQTVNVDGVDVDAHDAIALHERTEWPLMHLDKPMTADGIARLRQQIGGRGLTKSIYTKLLHGTPLTYQEAHYVATLAENHYVSVRYGIDPELYQQALKPYIEKARAAAQAEGNTHQDIDEKPNRDSGELDELKNAQRKPGVREAVGAGLGGAAGLAAYEHDKNKPGAWKRPLEGMFAGVVSAEAPIESFRDAERMEAAGIDPDIIWQKTGVMRGMDGKLRYEFSDHNARWKLDPKSPPSRYMTLGRVLDHPELYKRYPGIENTIVQFTKDQHPLGLASRVSMGLGNAENDYIGLRNRPTDTPDAMFSTLHHEIQHIVQRKEGFSRGSNFSLHKEMNKSRLIELARQIRDYITQYRNDRANGKMSEFMSDKLQSLLDEVAKLEDEQQHILDYYGNTGELEPRVTEDRRTMDEETRRRISPRQTARENLEEIKSMLLKKRYTRANDLIEKYFPNLDEWRNKTSAQEDLNEPSDNRGKLALGLGAAGGAAGALAYRKHPVAGGLAGVLAGLALPFAGEGSHGSLLDTLHEGGAVNPNGELSGLMDERGELPNEQNLIEQAKNGDRAAFTKLINRYGPRLVRALRPFERSVSGMDAQDLAQEAFIKAYNNIHDFNGESKFYTWLHRIGMNTAYDAIRSAKREPQIVHPSEYVSTGREGMDPEDQRAHQVQTDMEQIPEGLTNPESIAVSNQTGELIQKAMARLPDKLRLAVDLADFQGFSDQEIADKLGLPRATVATWLNRAHASIQDYLASEGNTRAIGPKGQRGAMSVESMKRLALIGGGAALGYHYGHSWKDIIGGAALGAGASVMSVRGTYRAIRGLGDMSPELSIKSLADTHEGNVGVAYRSLAVLQHAIDKLVPNTEDRVKITHWLDGDKSIQLTPEQLRAAQMAQKFFEYMKQEGLKHKVLKNAISNYVTHLWGGKNTSPLMDTLFKQNKSDPMSATSRFALKRTFSTLAEGKAAGLTPTTEDISDILGVYGRSMIKAVMNKKFVDALKDAKTPDGQSLLMSSTKAPTNYVRINHPQLARVSVHPGIAPEMRFLFDADNPNDMLTALEGVNTAAKRMNVSFSLFHGKSLFDAAMASGWNPIKTMKIVTQSAAGRSIFNKMILEGKAGDLVDTAIRAGLRFQFKRGTGVDPDVQEGFYPMLESLQRFAEHTIPGAGKVPEGLIKVNRAADKVLWENLHAGLKLSVFSKTLETLKENWAKERMRNPDEKVPTDDELAASAASYTNDMFGGLNWRRVAEDARTEIGRRLKMGMLSPAGRKTLELAMFAPDWKIATFRAFYKALGEGSGWKGLIHPKTLADLHRGYILRSAIYYLATGDAINYHFSGHHIWQNKDPTMIDLGDGRKMQWSKHAMEGPDWILKPRSQMLNSLGVIPKQGLEQALDVRWLSPEGNAPKIRDRLGHLVNSVLPISAASYSEGGGAGAISSFLGAPIYGRKALTKQQKAYKAEQTRRLHELSKFQ